MAMKARYTVIDGEIIAEKRNGVRRLYVPDPLGSTVALVDNTQTQTDTFGYWPYGENNGRTGTTATPFQFVGTAGYYRDSNTREYVRARMLDTAKGRWLTGDPIGFIGGDWNLYRYVGNAPSNAGDRSGLQIPNPLDYGNYCGPKSGPGPTKDCIDKACKAHDDCVPNVRQFCIPFRRFWCDRQLCAAAIACATRGCLTWQCKTVSWEIATLMCTYGTIPLQSPPYGPALYIY